MNTLVFVGRDGWGEVFWNRITGSTYIHANQWYAEVSNGGFAPFYSQSCIESYNRERVRIVTEIAEKASLAESASMIPSLSDVMPSDLLPTILKYLAAVYPWPVYLRSSVSTTILGDNFDVSGMKIVSEGLGSSNRYQGVIMNGNPVTIVCRPAFCDVKVYKTELRRWYIAHDTTWKVTGWKFAGSALGMILWERVQELHAARPRVEKN